MTLPTLPNEYASSRSSSLSNSYIECLDNNVDGVDMSGKSKRAVRRKEEKHQTGGLCMEEYHSDNSDNEIQDVEKIIEEINKSFSPSLSSSPRSKKMLIDLNKAVNSRSIYTFKCLCRRRCKCICHSVNIKSHSNSLTSSSFHGSNNNMSSSLDWEDLDLNLIQPDG